jgi:hypothetical protein
MNDELPRLICPREVVKALLHPYVPSQSVFHRRTAYIFMSNPRTLGISTGITHITRIERRSLISNEDALAVFDAVYAATSTPTHEAQTTMLGLLATSLG